MVGGRVSGSTVHLPPLADGWTTAPRPPVPAMSSRAGKLCSVAHANHTAGANADTAGVELRVLLQQLRRVSGLTYERLAERAHMSRSTVGNYLTTPDGRPLRTLESLLDALGASEMDRARALHLHKQTLPAEVDPVEVGWQASARAAGCTAWRMTEFSANEATVHTAIGRRHPARPTDPTDLEPPPYVMRVHDPALHRDIGAVVAGHMQALIMLRGTSSTGKTRSLWEAVHALCPTWMVVRPHDAAALRRLPASKILDRPVVLWLNELQGFLGPRGHGLSVDVLRRLYRDATAPLVVVGTLWPSKLRAHTDPRDERTVDSRDLLTEATPWVRWHEVARTLTTEAECDAARDLAARDPRLFYAVADSNRFGFAQTLAGAHELLDHYRNADQPARLLLDAAADARRLGHFHALPARLLRALTLALWREQHGSTHRPPTGWFPAALAYASEPLRGDDGVRPLISLYSEGVADTTKHDEPDDVEIGDPEPTGYALADYLEQHLAHARRLQPVGDSTWHALRVHVDRADDLLRLAASAESRVRWGHTEALLRKASNGGDRHVLRKLARWLCQQPGREVDAEQAHHAILATNDPGALIEWITWLAQQQGREPEFEQAYRNVVTSGDPTTIRQLAWSLRGKPGREAHVELAYVAAAGPIALGKLRVWLDQQRREANAPPTDAGTIASDDLQVQQNLAPRSENQSTDDAKARNAHRVLSDSSAPSGLIERAEWLTQQPGRETEAEAAYRAAFAAGHRSALRDLAEWLAQQPGRESNVEQAYRDALNAEDDDALLEFALWLATQPGRESETQQIFRAAVAIGHDPATLYELEKWLGTQPGREAEIEQMYRDAIAAGHLAGLREFADWLERQPGRAAEAEQVYRDAAVAGEPDGLRDLTRWLAGQPGRQAEAELVRRVGLDAQGRTVQA